MVSQHTLILCISIAFFALTSEGIEAKSYKFSIPPGESASDIDFSKLDLNGIDPSNIDKSKLQVHKHGNSTGGNVHTYRYKLPGKETNHTYRYKLPGKTSNHTYRYKSPGEVNHHTYRYKRPGKVHHHTYRYKRPGKVHHHTYQYKLPGKNVSHSYRYKVPEQKKKTPKPVSGVYYLINLMYNYFAVGGHLTGVPPVDLLMLRYYLAEGPRNFCPNKK